jgi:hypothetical protein
VGGGSPPVRSAAALDLLVALIHVVAGHPTRLPAPARKPAVR